MEELAKRETDALANEAALPPGWASVTIGDVADTTSGGTPSRKVPPYFGGNVPWIKSGELRDTVINQAEEYITEDALANSSAKVFPAGTSLVALYGATVGRTGILGVDAATNQAVCAIFPLANAFTAKYMTYWLYSQRQNLINLSVGGAQPNINQGVIRAYPFPLAPLNEQRRIVAAIEAQFTRLDAGVAALKRLQANLKRYKAAVLKAACEGRLVPQDADDEPASDLLARILTERRAKWETEQRAKGKDPRKLTYPEPAAPDIDGLPDLPDGWVWATTDQLSATEKYALAIGPFGSNLLVNDYRSSGIPLIFVKEIRTGVFDRPGLPHITPEKAEELRAHHVHPGDVVITKMGEPPGDVAILPDSIPLAVATSDCIKWTLSTHLNNRLYFMYGIRFPVVKQQILKITRGVAQQKMSLGRFKGLAIPVPPLAEQDRIVTALEEILSHIDEIDETLNINLHRAERLRQSILKEAFAGRLVPQDPALQATGDEPASDLLARIRHERAARKGQLL